MRRGLGMSTEKQFPASFGAAIEDCVERAILGDKECCVLRRVGVQWGGEARVGSPSGAIREDLDK